MGPLILHPLNEGVRVVYASDGQLVGTLKLIRGQWKFKALGFDAAGDLIPGGGLLTDKHNTIVAQDSSESVTQALIATGWGERR